MNFLNGTENQGKVLLMNVLNFKMVSRFQTKVSTLPLSFIAKQTFVSKKVVKIAKKMPKIFQTEPFF